MLDEMIQLPDTTESLAFAGDAALKLGSLHFFWNENIPPKSTLDGNCTNVEKNGTLASKLFDPWMLSDGIVGLEHDPHQNETTEMHYKGTFIEAIFGILYIEGGLDAVMGAMVSSGLILETGS